MKILNLYAGIGGNRKLWGDEHEITAVEYDPKIAKVYRHYFPNDTVVIEDAHQYLLDHHSEFDLVWASPPCPTHSITNHFLNVQGHIRYPAMELYQEIIYLQHFHKGLYLVENVISYYQPLIEPQKRGRHYFWANFKMPEYSNDFVQIGTMNQKARLSIGRSEVRDFERELGYDLSSFDLDDPRKVLRNCVIPELGLAILEAALGKKQKSNVDQLEFIL
jgi:DNA (cytosine-5)-methyltransferase 1